MFGEEAKKGNFKGLLYPNFRHLSGEGAPVNQTFWVKKKIPIIQALVLGSFY